MHRIDTTMNTTNNSASKALNHGDWKHTQDTKLFAKGLPIEIRIILGLHEWVEGIWNEKRLVEFKLVPTTIQESWGLTQCIYPKSVWDLSNTNDLGSILTTYLLLFQPLIHISALKKYTNRHGKHAKGCKWYIYQLQWKWLVPR
jgi:hypothetical protein